LAKFPQQGWLAVKSWQTLRASSVKAIAHHLSISDDRRLAWRLCGFLNWNRQDAKIAKGLW
jgi:hypothetical protein